MDVAFRGGQDHLPQGLGWADVGHVWFKDGCYPLEDLGGQHKFGEVVVAFLEPFADDNHALTAFF